MGPLLFIIYINELPEVVNNRENCDTDSDVIIYADDNSPTTSHSDPQELLEKVQNDGKKVTDWFSKNEMVCSGEKQSS